MTIDGKIRDGKLWYDIKRETAKISALSSGEIDKYEYLTGEDQYLMIKSELWDKLSLHVLLLVKHLKNK